MAEGRRGRRWREAVVTERGLRHALLLETSPEGRFLHLELATPIGLLTLHPEPDGTLHGNALDRGGLRHVEALPWAPDGVVDLAGSPVSRAALAHALRPVVAPGSSVERMVLWITDDLELGTGPQRIERVDAGTWRAAGQDAFSAQPDDLVVLRDPEDWPLDRDAPGPRSGASPG